MTASTPSPRSQSSRGSQVLSTPYQSAAGYASSSIADIELQREVAFALLVLHQSRQPFRRIDLSRVMNEKRISEQTYDWAKVHLLKVFGLKVMEVMGNPSHSIIVRERKVRIRTKRELCTDMHNALLTLALAVIFMSGENGCTMDKLSDLFSMINMDEETEVWTGSTSVKLRDLYTRLWVKQLYLEKTEEEDYLNNRKETRVRWGFRAQQEYEERQVLDLVAQVMGTKAAVWREQFARATSASSSQQSASSSQTPNNQSQERQQASVRRRTPASAGDTRRTAVRRGILSERINRPEDKPFTSSR